MRSTRALALLGALAIGGAGAVVAGPAGPAAGDEAGATALVELNEPAAPTAVVVGALDALGLDVTPLRHVPAAVVRGPLDAVLAAAAVPGVLGVELDRPLELYLEQTVPMIGAASVRDDLGIDGAGVTVAVVDSGIDATHPDLALGSKVVQNVKILGEEHYVPGTGVVVEDVPSTDTTSGHGTHVAGIVAGDGTASSGRYRGVAPGARLVGVGAGESFGMVTAAIGLDWVIDNRDRYGIEVVNNSWGDGFIEYDPGSVLNRATKAAHDAGITVVMAAGNDGAHGAGRISRYCIPDWVVCVGASTKTGALASLSSRGDPADETWWVDVLAPGEYVTSARSLTAPGATVNFSPFDLTDPAAPRILPTEYWTTYEVKSGTSMAAPHVAGVAALLLQANPRLGPDAVREVLKRTARPVAGCQPHACGAGLVDARAGVDLVRGVKNVKKFVKDGWSFWGAEVVQEWSGTVPASLFGSAVHRQAIAVPAGAVSLDVTVTWPATSPADLDLALRRPDGSVAAQAVGSIAQTSTVAKAETLAVTSPAAGSWSADVSGFLSAGQAYAGVASVVVPL